MVVSPFMKITLKSKSRPSPSFSGHGGVELFPHQSILSVGAETVWTSFPRGLPLGYNRAEGEEAGITGSGFGWGSMAASYRIDVERGVIFSSYSGTVTLADVRAAMAAARADPRVRPEFRTLVDCSAVTDHRLWFDETVAVVEFIVSDALPRMTGRLAFYVPARNVVYGALRQFKTLSGNDGRIEVFTDRNAARSWIGLPPE